MLVANYMIIKLEDIKSGEKKLCKASDCKQYTEDDSEYCYDHGECRSCYDYANRSDDFYCNHHKMNVNHCD